MTLSGANPAPPGVKATVRESTARQAPGLGGLMRAWSAPGIPAIGCEYVSKIGVNGVIGDDAEGLASTWVFTFGANHATCTGAGSVSHARAATATWAVPLARAWGMATTRSPIAECTVVRAASAGVIAALAIGCEKPTVTGDPAGTVWTAGLEMCA